MNASESQILADRFIRIMAKIEAMPKWKQDNPHRFAIERCRDNAYSLLRHAFDLAQDQIHLAREIEAGCTEQSKAVEVVNG